MRIIKKYLLFGLLFTFLSFYTQGQKKVNIGISIDKKTDQTSILLESLKKEITAVVGEDAELFFSAELENNFNTDLAKENYETIVSNNVDIILAFGVVNNYVISQFES
jgi:outer membrane protein